MDPNPSDRIPSLLAEVRPQAGEVEPGWRALAEGILLREAGGRRAGEAVIALDASDGRNVLVRFGAASMSMTGVLEDDGEEPEGTDGPLYDLVWQVGRSICVALRWGLHTEHGVVPYVPAPCSECGTLTFDDEDSCPGCARAIDGERNGRNDGLQDESTAEAHAERLVRALLDAGDLELSTPRSASVVMNRLATPLLKGWDAAAIGELLLELEPVSDLYCDNETLGATIESTRPR